MNDGIQCVQDSRLAMTSAVHLRWMGFLVEPSKLAFEGSPTCIANSPLVAY